MVTIREKKYEDCAECERVYTLTWQQTYRGIIPDDFLDRMSIVEDERTKNKQAMFHNDPYKKFVLVDDDKIVGVTSFGKSRKEEYPDCGELQTLYILEEYKGKGYGKQLFLKAVEVLSEMGYKDMIVGCFKGNPTCNFYKKMGGEYVKSVMLTLGKYELEDDLYIFRNIESLLK